MNRQLILFSAGILTLFALLCCRGWMYRHLILYHSLRSVSVYKITDPELQKELDVQGKEMQDPDIHEIAQQALCVTAQTLQYSFEQHASDPNVIFHSHEAHCIGYAAFFSAVCTALIRQKGLSDEWDVRHCRGKLYLKGVSLHTLFTNSFFRDHDYVILKNRNTGEQFSVDPVLFEFTWIDQIRSLPSP